MQKLKFTELVHKGAEVKNKRLLTDIEKSVINKEISLNLKKKNYERLDGWKGVDSQHAAGD